MSQKVSIVRLSACLSADRESKLNFGARNSLRLPVCRQAGAQTDIRYTFETASFFYVVTYFFYTDLQLQKALW